MPPHPLKDQVAVGDFELDENTNKFVVETGESFEYKFNIYGEGNISGINNPNVPKGKDMDIYPPNVSIDVNRGAGRVTGSKAYTYYGIPNDPGEYELKDYFNWIFFQPKTEVYDTLSSKIKLNVSGESKQNVSISSTDLGSFYDKIDFVSNDLKSLSDNKATEILANLLIIAMLGTAAFMFIKK